jgi:hypothetical protein
MDSISPGSNGDLKMETFVIQRDMNRDLRFTGRMIASVASTSDQANSQYINEQIELSLYKTQAGAFVCNRVIHILLEGERDATKPQSVTLRMQ